MTKISLQAARSANAAAAKEKPLTAVFTGGTSGIGEFTIRALVVHYGQSKQPLRLYLVGRNSDAAANIFADCRKICPDGDFRFIQAGDLSLLRDVDKACKEVERLETELAVKSERAACIDLLFMSHADFYLGPRRETGEGIDKTMSMLYYSRMRFATNLMPLLQATRRPSHVISVFGAGLEKLKDWHPDDLSLRQEGHYTMAKYRTHVVIMSTLFLEKLAQQHENKVSFVHVFPGLVITPAFGSEALPWWFKVVWTFMGPIAKYLFAVSSGETGERMLYLASDRYSPRNSGPESMAQQDVATSTDGVRGGGAYSCKHTGDTNDVVRIYTSLREQKVDEKVWEHTREVFEAIEGGDTFGG